MNERILELAEQADLFADSKLQMKGEYHPDWHGIRDKKFSELIVRECINIVDNLPNGYKDYRNTIENEFREDCINTMKNHFGVER
jgi:hypothetical protein